MTSGRPASWLRYPIAVYDRFYRWMNDLDRPESLFGPVIRLRIVRSRRDVWLHEDCLVSRGDPIGVIHLNNERIVALHTSDARPSAVGFTFRRQFLASLGELAAHTDPGRSLAQLRAFTATTILHHGLCRLGFAPARDASGGSAVAGAYQRALLASLRPSGRTRLDVGMRRRAETVWMSREQLRARFRNATVGDGRLSAPR